MSEKIGLIIPCRNVASTIDPLFDSLSPVLLSKIDRILCIDNASKDNTVGRLLDLQCRNNTAYSEKIYIIKNSEDYNYGGSIKIGFRHFIESDFDWAIILHSDGQGEANSILASFFSTKEKHPSTQIILASRFKKESDTSNYSRSRILGNLVFNGVTTITTGLCISDSGAAISMIRISLLKSIPFFQITNGLHFHPQLNILIYSRPDIIIQEVPILWKDSDLPSSVRVFKYCIELFKMLIAYRLNLLIGKKGAQLFTIRDEHFSPIFEVIPPSIKKTTVTNTKTAPH